MSPTKVHKRSLKCTVVLEIHAVGSFLQKQSNIYLSVCVLGQCQKTSCVPPVFPLCFHQKMIFEKIFPRVVDPADVADLLEADTTYFELIQIVPPEGEILATLKESTREFLYPGQNLTREKTQQNEKKKQLRRTKAEILNGSQKSTFFCSPISPSKQQQKKCADSEASGAEFGYLRPTVSSRARALSPYTHRRMCQLSDEARQRLSHLQLGPHVFKKATNNLPPFSVPCCSHTSQVESHSSPTPHQAGSTEDHTDVSLLGSYRPRADKMEWSYVRTQSSPGTSSRHEAHPKSPAEARLNVSRSLSTAAAPHSSLKERFEALEPSPSYSEQIHRRVRRILRLTKPFTDHQMTSDLPDPLGHLCPVAIITDVLISPKPCVKLEGEQSDNIVCGKKRWWM
ncbi:hypothetical protein WMY93_025330 [Mugilogobius chulae]|uniref:Spermatogenesis-associated protein 6 N-terminal domain-containing protein n=1 Tax=Mugilogobius chulae TaxID=88201 RepID=A0AAW0N731_9GOBI